MNAASHKRMPRHGHPVELRDVSRAYRIDSEATISALDRVSLAVPIATAVALTGPSGSGKSTLLPVVGALDRPDSGEVCVGGVDITRLSRRELPSYRRQVGFVFQRFNLLPALSALDNVIAPVLPYRVDFDPDERGRMLLEAVGLAGRETSLPSRLSGGQQQRVAIARALINRPSVILADEPTGNLDSHTGAEIVDLLVGLRDQHGMTLLLATHDEQVAARCDQRVRLKDGRIQS
jgi:putative ABC transport system ATP-binding protein